MFPQVWQRVVRGTYRSATATLEAHARFEIAGETYPGMIARDDGSVQGVLYFNVTDEDVARLDAFEGSEYRRDVVTVTLDAGEQAAACTYIYLLPQRLAEAPWRPEAFRMTHFLDTYCRDKLGE